MTPLLTAALAGGATYIIVKAARSNPSRNAPGTVVGTAPVGETPVTDVPTQQQVAGASSRTVDEMSVAPDDAVTPAPDANVSTPASMESATGALASPYSTPSSASGYTAEESGTYPLTIAPSLQEQAVTLQRYASSDEYGGKLVF